VRDARTGPHEQLVARVAEDVAELLIHAQEAAVEMSVADADRGVFERAAEPLLALAQLSDVRAGAEPFDDIPAGVADRHAARFEPAILAVAAADAVFDIVGVMPRDRFEPKSGASARGRPVQRLEPLPPEQVRLCNACVLRPLRAKVIACAIHSNCLRPSSKRPA